jgi:serine phosphatase RsbU (regulator of sigma subunit)
MTAPGSNAKRPLNAPQTPAPQRLASFWGRVTDGLELSELWRQFQSEARASYGFYSKEVDWESIQKQKGAHKGLAAAKAFFWALVMKLSPARRVVLLIALGFLLLGSWQFDVGEASMSLNIRAYGVLLLLLLLALELADRVTMKRDLEIARDIQRWLVPEKPPNVPGCDIAFATRPANTVAGDYYDVVRRQSPGGERWLIVVADVAGKSVPAALLMATFQASLQTLSATASSLADLVTGLNRFSAAHSLGGMRFTTAFVAELDPVTRSLAYVNAGHNSPILRRAAGAIERLEIGSIPFGIAADTAYPSAAVTLAPGDLLVIFTDGLVEAVNERGEEFTDARLLEILSNAPPESAAALQTRMMTALDAFVGRARQHDDTTSLVLRVL